MRYVSLRKNHLRPIKSQILVMLVFALLFSHRATAGNSSDGEASSVDASSYELVGIARLDGISYASIIEPQSGYHFLLSTVDPSADGLVLASVRTDDDPSGPSVTVREDGVNVVLAMGVTTTPSSSSVFQSPPAVEAVNVAPAITQKGQASAGILKPPPGAMLPLVFQEVDPAKMRLTDDQKVILSQLRQDFINAVNGTGAPGSVNATTTGAAQATTDSSAATNQNTTNTNTAYQNWLSAQDKSDATFRMEFGTQAFNAYTESSAYPTAP
jgi:hypothetical protein